MLRVGFRATFYDRFLMNLKCMGRGRADEARVRLCG